MIEVKKNQHYWDAKTVRLNGIRFYPIEAVYTEERAYRSGFLHLTQSVSADRIEFLRKKHPDELHYEPYLGTYFYRFNLKAPPFDDQRVREAFSLAIDRQRLVDKVLKVVSHLLPASLLLGLVGLCLCRNSVTIQNPPRHCCIPIFRKKEWTGCPQLN